MTQELTTRRLILRPVCADDYDDLVKLWRDENFTRFTSGRPLSEEEVWFRLLRDIGHWQIKNYGNWTIRDSSSHIYLGSVGAFDYRRDIDVSMDSPELGWGIPPQYHGQGIASEALESLIEYLDKRPAFERTVCMISPDNHASVKLAARNGYRQYAKTDYKGFAVNLFERFRMNCASES